MGGTLLKALRGYVSFSMCHEGSYYCLLVQRVGIVHYWPGCTVMVTSTFTWGALQLSGVTVRGSSEECSKVAQKGDFTAAAQHV